MTVESVQPEQLKENLIVAMGVIDTFILPPDTKKALHFALAVCVYMCANAPEALAQVAAEIAAALAEHRAKKRDS
jgi:hypothetical protein